MTTVEELKARHERELDEAQMEQDLVEKHGYPQFRFAFHKNRNYVHYDVESVAEIREIMQAVPPSEDQHVFDDWSREKQVLEHPYRYDVHKRAGYHCAPEFSVKWKADPYDVNIKFKGGTEAFADFLHSHGDRKVTDSEYIYFPGVGTTEIGKIRVPNYQFKKGNRPYYGGYNACDSAEFSQEITDFIMEVE